MEQISVTMVRGNLENLPSYDLPAGFRIRYFKRGEERLWAEIEVAADEFDGNLDLALERFDSDFGVDIEGIESRGFFMETDTGYAIGTATAWYDTDFLGQDYGRVHWVGIRPEYHGRGLGRSLVGAVMARLVESHERAYLKTLSTRLAAIKIYLDFGFQPLVSNEDCERAWGMITEQLRHPALEGFGT
ncbi:MAG: GNAT family N-acetyltransferase [Armatimonadota bacterium]|nr:GNAT family N-acetyltransferase [Armatimonadota bacterium]